MSLVIFGDLFTFPDGGAATNRVFTYGKGFVENGVKTHVICFASEYTSYLDGETEKIKYYHPFAQTVRHKRFLVRRWQKFLKYFRTYKVIRDIHKQEKITVINVWTNLLVTHLFSWVLAKVLGVRLVVECSEHPLRFFQGSKLNQLKGKAKFFLESNLNDGVFCISKYLVDFYLQHGANPSKLLLVPSTVDPTRFIKNSDRPVQGPFIGYFGSLTFDRDNVDVLINAFYEVSKSVPNYQLILGGFCNAEDKKAILNLVSELKLESRFTLLGFLSREEILAYVNHANILVMIRANNLQSQASFPSKLTEFLASANPVITVDVGEITDFLSDGKDAFIVEPGNSTALAEKILYVIENYEQAKIVGLNGQKLTNSIFNYKYQADRMLGFIRGLN
ncbi:MAG: glycosyltransferase family 4 protein [Bacteroidales bacterium]|nr:glycosyltransferase family 4 protein [Bacteroidales bacterium]